MLLGYKVYFSLDIERFSRVSMTYEVRGLR